MGLDRVYAAFVVIRPLEAPYPRVRSYCRGATGALLSPSWRRDLTEADSHAGPGSDNCAVCRRAGCRQAPGHQAHAQDHRQLPVRIVEAQRGMRGHAQQGSLLGQPQRRSTSTSRRPGSTLSARVTSRNSIASSRRSPDSTLEMNDWGRRNFCASSTCVRPAARRASASARRSRFPLRVNADLVTPAVCYPTSGYPKMGYAGRTSW